MTEQDHAGSELLLEGPLDVVSASNYLGFGAGSRGATAGDPDLLPACLSLIDAGGNVLYTLEDLRLVKSEASPRQIVWAGFALHEGYQIGWVWDFFRVLSHVILRQRTLGAGDEPGGLAAALDRVQAGDSLRLAINAAGGFAQSHVITETFLAGWNRHRAG